MLSNVQPAQAGDYFVVISNVYGSVTSAPPATLTVLQAAPTPLAALHTFTGGSDGANPYAGLVLSANALYGTAVYGGSSNAGTVFRVSTNGTGFATLHSFSGGGDGAQPFGGLILSGTTLYGTTSSGGSSSAGTVFSLNADGTGFTTLHSFGGGSDGAQPWGELVLSGNTLYGAAGSAGSLSAGTVFSVNTDGTGFATLHNFNGGSDGAGPYAGLVLSGNTLYGTADVGGTSDEGTVFSVNTDGSGFTVLHTFSGGIQRRPAACPIDFIGQYPVWGDAWWRQCSILRLRHGVQRQDRRHGFCEPA